MSASIDTKIRPLRRVTPDAAPKLGKSPFRSALEIRISGLRRLFSEELGCKHNQLVFDDINDVYCKRCGMDFTG